MIKAIITDQQFLRQPSQPATLADRVIAQDLKDTLAAHRNECIGMAANMIGEQKRVIIASLGPVDLVMFNPQITTKKQPYQTKEGCLSLTGQRPTKRYREITVTFFNQDFAKQTLELTGLAAEIVQHEIDHCNGILI